MLGLKQGDKVDGVVYIVRTPRKQNGFILSATFAPSKTKARQYLKHINNIMCEKHVPIFEPVALVKATITIDSFLTED